MPCDLTLFLRKLQPLMMGISFCHCMKQRRGRGRRERCGGERGKEVEGLREGRTCGTTQEEKDGSYREHER